ncbi:hypothetical protein [Novosphingobium sp. PhB165]|uniref:hypothetical protein n=1 Tax=Novosphingobium sp. PhB165 TaxID=2485105 RepID=UPI00104AA04C|nr:hypothetical protein [Novosphingobium sp. PhB165]
MAIDVDDPGVGKDYFGNIEPMFWKCCDESLGGGYVNTRKKSIMGRPKVGSEEVSVRMNRAQLDAIDAWRACQDGQIGRPEAIRRLVRKA